MRTPRMYAQPVNQLSGVAHSHSVMIVMYAIINLHPGSRMSAPAIQVACIVNDHTAKEVSMNEIINGGTTSIGAQLRRLQHASSVSDPFRTSDTGERLMTVHAVLAAGDFPALASLLPSKGSVSAHLYDRKSTLDQTSDVYGKPFSLLHPDGEGAFRSVRHVRPCISFAHPHVLRASACVTRT